MAIQSDETLVTKGDLKTLYTNKILPYLGGNFALKTRVSDYYIQDEEILIGVQGDGRPLYRKSIVVSNILDNASTYTTATIPHGITNIRINGGVTVYGCWVVGDNSGGTLPTHAYNNGGTSEYLWDIYNIDSTNITISYKGDQRNVILVIHIEYTKTTDAANSAITTAGCYDINFPNTQPANKEIYFGNGLYGYHAVGTATGSALAAGIVLVANVPRTAICYNKGGMIDMSGTGGTNQYDINGGQDSAGRQTQFNPLMTNTITNNVNNFRFYCQNNQGITSGNIQYNIWFTYTK